MNFSNLFANSSNFTTALNLMMNPVSKQNLYYETKVLIENITNNSIFLTYGNGSLDLNLQIDDNISYIFLSIYENLTVHLEFENYQPISIAYFQITGGIFVALWIVANFIGVYCAGYMKHDINWIYGHVILSGGSGIITIIIGIISLQYCKLNIILVSSLNYISDLNRGWHIFLTRILIFVLSFQISFGVLIYLILHKFNPSTGMIHKVKIIHKITGYFITYLAYLILLLGINNAVIVQTM